MLQVPTDRCAYSVVHTVLRLARSIMRARAGNSMCMHAGTMLLYLLTMHTYHIAGAFYEMKLHYGPVTRMRVSFDDCLLVTSGEDGSVVVMDIRDKDLAKASTRQQLVRFLQ